jgi:hypothetical protein
MADTRLRLALPIDVARLFDSTVTQAQINSDTFPPSNDSDDLLASMIEDAENEFHQLTDSQMKLSTVGVEGQRETFEQPTYKISGHRTFKARYTGVFSDFDPDEKRIELENERLLPFDKAEGDRVYIYNGIGDGVNTWEDITDDQGDMWAILDHRRGTFVFDPEFAYEQIVGTRDGVSTVSAAARDSVRFAIRYRYGGLGGTRSTTATTSLDQSLTSSSTGSVDVTDAGRLPGTSEVVVKIGREYLSIRPDPTADTVEILDRGVRGTTAASHDADDEVQYTPGGVRKAVAAHAAENLVTSGRYQGYLPDTEDDLDRGDMLDQFSEMWDTTIAALS